MIKTVLGSVSKCEIRAALCHEHICCCSEYLKTMSGGLFDEEELMRVSVSRLTWLREKYNVNLFVDCTPVNLGRDIDLLKSVSEASGVHIVCATGFYHTEECLFSNRSADFLAELYIKDAEAVNAGVIKAAVESETLSALNEKLLLASAKAHHVTGLPIVLHTNAKNQNGIRALVLLLKAGVSPSAITIGHLSDTEDTGYILKIAEYGCFIGLDRLRLNTTEEYIQNKLKVINALIEAGFENRIILSHDALVYSEFDMEPKINENARFNYVFDHILNRLPSDTVKKIIEENPVRMLGCK